MKGYSRRFLPALLASFIVLLGTGLLLLPTVLDLRFGFDVAWRLPGAHSTWVAGIHSAAALLVCGFVGALWSIHMRAGWHSRRHRLSGPATFALLVGAALTALGVVYLGDPAGLAVASAFHTLLASGAVVVGGIHWRLARVERAGRRSVRSNVHARPATRRRSASSFARAAANERAGRQPDPG
jgi:hypothetical protein